MKPFLGVVGMLAAHTPPDVLREIGAISLQPGELMS